MINSVIIAQSDYLAPGLSGIVVGSMTLAGVYLTHRLDLRKQRKKEKEDLRSLRNGLATELRLVDHWVERVLYASYDPSGLEDVVYQISRQEIEQNIDSNIEFRIQLFTRLNAGRKFSKTIYESNGDKIGELNPSISKQVINAYNHIEELKRLLARIDQIVKDIDDFDRRVSEWESSADLPKEVRRVYDSILSEVLIATIYQKGSLFALGSNMSKSDQAAVTFALAQRSPGSEAEEDVHELASFVYEKADSWEEFKQFI